MKLFIFKLIVFIFSFAFLFFACSFVYNGAKYAQFREKFNCQKICEKMGYNEGVLIVNTDTQLRLPIFSVDGTCQCKSQQIVKLTLNKD